MHRRPISTSGSLLAAVSALTLSACSGGGRAHSGQSILDALSARGVDVRGDARGTEPIALAMRDAALPELGVTLEQLLEAAEATHPRLAAARARVGESAGRVWQASLYPNPKLGASIDDLGMREGGETSTTMISVTQPIVLGSRLRAAMEAAEAEQRVRLAQIESERRALFSDVAELHASLLSLRAQESALVDAIDAARGTLGVVDARVEARAAPEPEALRPRIEVAQLEAERMHLSAVRRAAEQRLGLLVGTDIVGADRLADAFEIDPPALDASRLEASLTVEHPDLIAMGLEADTARARVRAVDATRTPDLELSIGVGYDDPDDQGVVALGAGAEIPLWDNREGDLLAARFEVLRIEHERAALEKSLRGELAQALAEYASARERLAHIRRRILPDAERAFEQVSESYRAGRTPFIEVLDAQRTLLQARRSIASLTGDATTARASVARLVGAPALAASSIPSVTTSPTESENSP